MESSLDDRSLTVMCVKCGCRGWRLLNESLSTWEQRLLNYGWVLGQETFCPKHKTTQK